MSVELDVEPLLPPPPPAPPPPVSLDEAMRRVAAATAEAPMGEELDSDVIRMRPRLTELSALDALQEARPLVARCLFVVALFIVLRLAWQLRQRYRRENVAETTAEPMDRRSVMRRRRKAE